MTSRHCQTCGNILCEFYIQHNIRMSFKDAHGWKMMTPAEFTLVHGCTEWRP